MKPQVFSGQNSKDAIFKVRNALGDDAVILSNKNVDGRTEIIAIAPGDIDKWALQASSTPQEHQSKSSDSTVMRELKEMRSMIESQLAGVAVSQHKSDPGRLAVAKAMLNAGFSALLARTISGYTKPGTPPEQALEWLRTGLSKHLKTLDREMIDEGGVFALVGPTGVGKTTTTAKIAARCAIKHGPRSFALLTTDTYRLAAEEQLRGFGKILGTTVHTISSVTDLKDTLDELKGKKLILIDTVGMSQKDKRVSEQVAMLTQAGAAKRVLVLNCATSGTVLDDVASVYTDSEHGPLYGAILTKADEAIHIGSALDVLIRRKLPLLYVTTGQRVPEDMERTDAKRLIEAAFAQSTNNPFAVSDFEMHLGGE
jgi:flagellar biosynthesis protein FlhF